MRIAALAITVLFAAVASGQLNRSNQPAASKAAANEYKIPGTGDDVVRVFYLNHARTPQDLQEAATVLRSIADIKYVFVYRPLNAIAVRGTAAQMALAEWLVSELNKPVPQAMVAPVASPAILTSSAD